jgi:hypothetical protein
MSFPISNLLGSFRTTLPDLEALEIRRLSRKANDCGA